MHVVRVWKDFLRGSGLQLAALGIFAAVLVETGHKPRCTIKRLSSDTLCEVYRILYAFGDLGASVPSRVYHCCCIRAATMVRGCFATLLLAILCAASIGHGIASLPKIDMVDTRIGSAGHGFGIGSINPGRAWCFHCDVWYCGLMLVVLSGAQVPFGAMRLGPDSSWGAWLHCRHSG